MATCALIMWVAFYRVYIMPGTMLDEEIVIPCVVWLSQFFLTFAGYSPFFSGREFCAEDEACVWIGDPCSPTEVAGVYAIVTLFLPSRIGEKLLFLVAGIVVLVIACSVRIALLALAVKKLPWIFEFNHSVLFNVLILGIMVTLWVMMVKKG